ncbi:hypothetical protein ABIH81_24315 [Micromonospora sp. HUAS YX12]|uniref:Uncharacterized protein n=1 Tax=Micromonospora sp. HUAS YX12 TaxID=3156396 RepID=A0AAU7R044_9ACTN
MRLLRRRRHLNRSECAAVIAAAATLAATFDITWRVGASGQGHSLEALAGSLVEVRREGGTFSLPEEARAWFDLGFDIPDTAYALALILVWSFAATRESGGGPPNGHVPVAMWHLRQLLPRSAHRALADIEHAFARFESPAPTWVG